ncbi:receptor like protein 29 [Manihot esculenta]|uniref:Leucine-rich repeat-containing N-terminal plant-type domain-containing protein n=1 Tax=Manihot esculenta TaxID=3983 RepID=A0A2C9WDP0_MANES|nr:receptor like protein 29 [Manihot esculenta]
MKLLTSTASPPFLSIMFSSFFSLPILLLFSLPSFSSVPVTNASKQPPPTANQSLLSTDDMLPSEAQTLFKIMDSLSSDHSWSTSYPNPCKPGSTWPGIECRLGPDDLLHVSRLDFGTSPNPTCKSTATFPNQIFALPYLLSVFFLNCFTQTKTLLSIPPNILTNSSLQQLSLRSNLALVGPIPSQISSLMSLQILTLSQNRLSGSIPAEIFRLSSLVHLDLSYNILTGAIPIELGNLTNLVGLDLSYNSLTGTIPDTIGQLGLLQKLDLSSNSLNGSIPDSIEQLSSLAFMALSDNRFSGNFPAGLPNLQSLQYFIMDDNPINIPLPVEFGKLVKLQELRLANSGYSGTIPPSFSLLMNLSTLSLQNNRLIGGIPEGFGSLSHIYHLNLSRNLLGGVVPFNGSFFKRLGRNLDLSGNPGLCLSPTQAYNVKIATEVGVCGTSKNGSLMMKSQASHGFSKSFFLFGGLLVLGLNPVLILVRY